LYCDVLVWQSFVVPRFQPACLVLCEVAFDGHFSVLHVFMFYQGQYMPGASILQAELYRKFECSSFRSFLLFAYGEKNFCDGVRPLPAWTSLSLVSG
jgi:hypothetical protein